ncbi:lysylphosphatidylglycerol synthase transmembrane domain-containing protein [Phytoactinopolyspora halophila]|uniref:lysylphosphatidylglycerol synthase transmembrane domain-containing protein n=1 Tax=Phytoactinopolyspora halophila TaxID=1981511 RepID=UPI0013148242|nr:lysylphosphatidylglycerol synthase transmembrane domain-containing protein [Phytoactinopolyspora halophila]
MSGKPLTVRRAGRWIGSLIAVAGLAFVLRELLRSWDDVRSSLSGATPVPLVAAVLVGAGGMLLVGLGWRRCLAVLGVRRSVVDTLYRYYVGQLGKYVPGGIWPVVGRGEMARRGGVPGAAAYASTVLSMVVTYLAALLTAVVALLLDVVDAGTTAGDWWLVLLVLPVGVLGLHPRVVNGVLRLGRRVSGRKLDVPVPRWPESVVLVLWHVPAWVAIGMSTWLVAVSLAPVAPDPRNLVFAAVVSWFVGFVVVGSPGGIGVREAVFVALAASLSSAGVAAAVALTVRVLFIVVDVVSAAVVGGVVRGRA